MMFAAFCPTHDARILMTRRNVVDFWNGPNGPVIHWRCNCGHVGFVDATGSHSEPIPRTTSDPAPHRIPAP